MKLPNRVVVIASSILALTACTTTLRVTRVDPRDPATLVGAPYPLMFTRYRIDITRQVASCGAQMKITTKVDVKSDEAAPDPRQLFVIDTNSLASPVKTSEVKLTYATSGAVTALNASAEDRSAQVIANAVGAIVKTVSLAAAAGAAPGAKAEACNEAVLGALKTIAKQKPIVEAATRVVEAHTEVLTSLTKKAATLGDKLDAATKKRISDAYDAVSNAQADLDRKQQVLDEALKVVRDVQTVYWPEQGDQAVGAVPLPPYLATRWGRIDQNPAVLAGQGLHLRLDPIDAAGRARANCATPKNDSQGKLIPCDPSSLEPDVVDAARGIPYRLPTTGRLRICQGQACLPDQAADVEKIGPVLQLGRVYYLPCESRAFTSIGCTFEMTDVGQIKTMGTSQKAAAAEGATGALKDGIAQLSTARLEAIKARTDLVKAQNDYAAAVAASAADPQKTDKDATAALNAQVDLMKAQVAKLEAEQALKDAQARFGSQ